MNERLSDLVASWRERQKIATGYPDWGEVADELEAAIRTGHWVCVTPEIIAALHQVAIMGGIRRDGDIKVREEMERHRRALLALYKQIS